MLSRTFSRLVLTLALALAAPAFAQSGLRMPERNAPGLDPTFARGWLAPDFDRFGFAYQWKEGLGFAPSQRMNWSYSFGGRGSLSMSLGAARDMEYDRRQFSLFGHYWLAPDWALSAEASSRESTGLLRLNDWRFGLQRRF
jgi:hypothetical protein